MATRVAQKFGAWAGPGPSYFRVVAEIWDYGDYGDGRKFTLYRYVQVNSGGGFGGTSLSNSWGSNIALHGAGNYGQNETTQYRKAYGETLSFPASTTTAYYYGGRKYESSVAISYTVPKPTYTISYDANGGIGAPGEQTKTWETNLTLSNTIPTRTGYKFIGWGTSSGDMAPDYQPGNVYKSNAGITLYAIWKRKGQMYLRKAGQYQRGRVLINDNGTYRQGIPWIKENGVWKRGGV